MRLRAFIRFLDHWPCITASGRRRSGELRGKAKKLPTEIILKGRTKWEEEEGKVKAEGVQESGSSCACANGTQFTFLAGWGEGMVGRRCRRRRALSAAWS